jgi:hypothetical protein
MRSDASTKRSAKRMTSVPQALRACWPLLSCCWWAAIIPPAPFVSAPTRVVGSDRSTGGVQRPFASLLPLRAINARQQQQEGHRGICSRRPPTANTARAVADCCNMSARSNSNTLRGAGAAPRRTHRSWRRPVQETGKAGRVGRILQPHRAPQVAPRKQKRRNAK